MAQGPISYWILVTIQVRIQIRVPGWFRMRSWEFFNGFYDDIFWMGEIICQIWVTIQITVPDPAFLDPDHEPDSEKDYKGLFISYTVHIGSQDMTVLGRRMRCTGCYLVRAVFLPDII